MKLDPTVKRILSMPNIDNFSAVEIRTAYLVLNNDQSLDPSDVRRFIYSEFVKLVNKGWLKKTISQKKGITRYTRTELFDSNALKVSETHDEPNSRQEDRKKQLLNRLFMYNEQLLQSSGAIKEFESLIKEFPDMQKGMQIKYNQTREHRTQLIGKINTLESLIKQYHFEDLT